MGYRLVPLLIAAYFGFFILIVLGMGYYWQHYKKPPEQPIAFPHKTHAGQVGLPCDYCHQYAARSPRAGIPPVQTCVSCHKNVAKDRPEIQKLLQYWDDQKPIPWVRVHSLSDYVYFTHKRHIKAGVKCAQCHGEVQNFIRMRKVRSLKMGWCVSCHRENGASDDCYTCHK